MSVKTATTSECAPADRGYDKGATDADELLSRLLVASGRRDEVAFAGFYQLTSPWIFDLMRRRTGSIGPAEEATRLVYVTSWRRAASYEPRDQTALTWLTSLAHDVVRGAAPPAPEQPERATLGR